MKCIGTVGHPLPEGEGRFSNHNPRPLPGERVPDGGLYRTVQTGGGRVRGPSIQWNRAAHSTYEFGFNATEFE
jgi:hypothetical protein